MEDTSLDQCQEIIDYQFKDISLLQKALRHASASATRLDSNERMEFLGDAVLGLCICETLFRRNADLLEGEMTKIKSTVVSRVTCAEAVRQLELCRYMQLSGDMSRPERVPESVVAGLFEAIIGAIYLDGGFAPAEKFILAHLQSFIDVAMTNSHHENYKSLLQQHAQRVSNSTPEYVMLDEQGPEHSKCFEVAVSIKGRNFDSAWGRNKKQAEQAAAMEALLELGVLKPDEDE